jgi:hippurate hydrolase
MIALALMLAVSPALQPLDSIYPDLDALYRDLHQTPELSSHEEKTAARLAERMRKLGYEVQTGVAGTGVVAVLHNGAGPTVLLRTELDALPVEEKTGLPYASHATGTDPAGKTVPVMHACGHDIHMTSWVGAATLLAQAKSQWRGTLIFVGQPAEETVGGAKAMVDSGLYQRVGKPDYTIAQHDSATLPAGQVGIVRGYALANVNSVDVTIYGKGGHGAYPQTTVDPIVIAARTVLALQTLVSRETRPLDPAVITVGSIHAGFKHNIIPDEAHLQITVRSYKPEVRKHLLEGIQRIVKAEAMAADAPKEPLVTFSEASDATYNDPKLADRLAGALKSQLGADAVVEVDPEMGAEDFGEFGRAASAPSVMLRLGAVDPARLQKARAAGESLPSLHSSGFAPDRERTLRTGVTALVVSALEVLGKP